MTWRTPGPLGGWRPTPLLVLLTLATTTCGGDGGPLEAPGSAAPTLPASDAAHGLVALEAGDGAPVVVEVDWVEGAVAGELPAADWAAERQADFTPLAVLSVCDHELGRPHTDCTTECGGGACVIRDPVSGALVVRESLGGALREAVPTVPWRLDDRTETCEPADAWVDAAWADLDADLLAVTLTPLDRARCEPPPYPVLLGLAPADPTSEPARRVAAQLAGELHVGAGVTPADPPLAGAGFALARYCPASR